MKRKQTGDFNLAWWISLLMETGKHKNDYLCHLVNKWSLCQIPFCRRGKFRTWHSWCVNSDGRRNAGVCNLRDSCESLFGSSKREAEGAGGIQLLSHRWAGMVWMPDVCGHARSAARRALAACCTMWKSLALSKQIYPWHSEMVCNLVLVPALFPQLQLRSKKSIFSSCPMFNCLPWFSSLPCQFSFFISQLLLRI